MSIEIVVDGNSIFIDNIEQNKPGQYIDDASSTEKVLSWTSEQIVEATKPVAAILTSLRNSAKEMAPDEMELSMQFALSLNGEVPVFKVVSAEAAAQIAVKCVWKKSQP